LDVVYQEIPDFEQRRAGHDLEWSHSSGGILGKNPVERLFAYLIQRHVGNMNVLPTRLMRMRVLPRQTLGEGICTKQAKIQRCGYIYSDPSVHIVD
jgi:hypothetical protein